MPNPVTDPSLLAQLEGSSGPVPITDPALLATLEQANGRGVVDQLFGIKGPRHQLLPERMVRGVLSDASNTAMLPGQVVKEAQQPTQQISDSDVSVLSVPSMMNFAAFTSPVNPFVRSGDKAIPGVSNTLVRQKPTAPSTEELAKAGVADINAAKNSGLAVTPSSVGDLSRNIQQQLMDSGVHPVQADATYRILKELENAPSGASVTAANLQTLRETLRNIAQANSMHQGAKDQLAASRAIKQLDQFLPSIDPKNVLAGTPAETARLFERGRGNYAAAMRSNDLTGVLDRANTGILERAETRAQAANSGRNLDNTIRQKIASLLEKPKEVSGFSDPELGALNKIVIGGQPRNAARYIGNLLGGGGGIGQQATAAFGGAGGAVAGGLPGAFIGAAAPTVVGATAKTIANALAKRSLNKTDELIRSRSPLFLDMLRKAPLEAGNLARREMIAKALLMNAMRGAASED